MKWYYWLLLLLLLPFMFGKKTRVRRRHRVAGMSTGRTRKRRTFVPRARGKRSKSGKAPKGMRKLNGRWYTNKAWGAAMKRLRKKR